jgi:hypothetical protein
MPYAIARPLVRIPPKITPAPPPPPTSAISGTFTDADAFTATLSGADLLLDGSGNVLTDDSGNPLING